MRGQQQESSTSPGPAPAGAHLLSWRGQSNLSHWHVIKLSTVIRTGGGCRKESVCNNIQQILGNLSITYLSLATHSLLWGTSSGIYPKTPQINIKGIYMRFVFLYFVFWKNLLKKKSGWDKIFGLFVFPRNDSDSPSRNLRGYKELFCPLSRCFLLSLKFGILVNIVLHLSQGTTQQPSTIHNLR